MATRINSWYRADAEENPPAGPNILVQLANGCLMLAYWDTQRWKSIETNYAIGNVAWWMVPSDPEIDAASTA